MSAKTLDERIMMSAARACDKELFKGLYNRDIALCRAALTAGANPSSRDPLDYGEVALTRAIERNFLEAIELLLKHGASTKAIPSTTIPLHYAAHRNNVAACRLLIAGGADGNVQDQHGRNALHRAAYETNLEVCRFLIDSGADVFALNSSQYSPLHIAAMRNSEATEFLRVLTRAGIDPEYRPKLARDGYDTPMVLAVRLGAHRSVHFFLAECGANPLAHNSEGATLVELAKNEETKAVLRAAATEREAACAIGSFDQTPTSIDRRAPSLNSL